MTVTVHVLTGSKAAATTESKCHWHSPNDATAFFFFKCFFFFFCRMWIAGNERGPTQSRFSCSDSDFCTKPLLAAHYTGTVQPNQRAGLGLHCCHGERIICIRKKKKRKRERRRFLHCGPDFVPTPAAGYGQLFQLVTFKSPTRGMFLKSQLDKSGLNMEVARKQLCNVTVANVKSQNVNIVFSHSRRIISSLN